MINLSLDNKPKEKIKNAKKKIGGTCHGKFAKTFC